MLSESEKHVLRLTVELVNSFCALPEEHPSDKAEFILAIHRIQDMVMARPTRRALNPGAVKVWMAPAGTPSPALDAEPEAPWKRVGG